MTSLKSKGVAVGNGVLENALQRTRALRRGGEDSGNLGYGWRWREGGWKAKVGVLTAAGDLEGEAAEAPKRDGREEGWVC